MEESIATVAAANSKSGALVQGPSASDKKGPKSKAFTQQREE